MSQFLAPDFYQAFVCKCSDCRTTCCKGWGITVSMSEYFRMLGLECAPELRRKLDTAFYPVRNPDKERYARLSPNWEGDCPLRAPDGLCTLHAQMGEGVLPAICRLYPRRISFGECALSGSCEGVIELLLQREEPVGFTTLELPVDAPGGRAKPHDRALRALAISVLQDRRIRISERMMRLGRIVGELSALERAGDSAGMGEAIARISSEECPSIGQALFGQDVTDITFRVAEVFSMNSESLSEYWEAGVKNHARADYPTLRRAFEEKYPGWERYFEQITVNHVIFSRFPYAPEHGDLWSAYAALVAAHCVLMYIATLYTYDREGLTPLADVLAAAFRMIDHSDFERRGHMVFTRLGLGTQEKLDQLLCAL